MPKQAKSLPARPRFTPVAVRRAHNGWTPARQSDFIDALAETGCVNDACAHVGMSRQSAYALRMRVDAQGFRVAWDAALDLAIRRLSDEVMSRAINGEVVPHFYKGEVVGEHRRYDNRLAMFLLRYRDPLRYAASLDQMVYSGHPETAAIAFAKARDRMVDAAYGVADESADPADPTGMPFARKPTFQAVAEQANQALVESNVPIGGTHTRREAFRQARIEHHARLRAKEQARAHAAATASPVPVDDAPAGVPHATATDPRGPERAPPTSASTLATLARQGGPSIRSV